MVNVNALQGLGELWENINICEYWIVTNSEINAFVKVVKNE
jgi:hypothetical protein